MTHASQDASHLSRRTALAGLVGGTGVALAAGCTSSDRTSAQGVAPRPTASDTGSSVGATPGVMTLFRDPAFNFSGLWALGGAGFGGSEVGEVLTAVNTINKAGLSAQTYVETFKKLGDQLMGAPEGSKPDRQTRRLRALRAAQYYAQALFFVLGSDTPESEEQLYRAGRGAWDKFCELCDPAPVTADIPYGKTPLPVWFFRPDDSGKQRRTVILTNGSDGQNVDMWAYGVSAALERDWNALVYDGPGQGQLLFVDRVVFTPRWERVVTPLVDWLVARSDVDADRIALTGLSMAGNLAPRAAAFEKRIAALVAMPGTLAGLPSGDSQDPHPEQGEDQQHLEQRGRPRAACGRRRDDGEALRALLHPGDARCPRGQGLHGLLHPCQKHRVPDHHERGRPDHDAHPGP
ncbi:MULTISPECIES: alpha/beta hydrolase family protein [unclassified Streptomyces]|uniref:alpha/beta hydrolase family protein n=2 Tax=unclassified Streptomyces TaxID=2593676 RepID=UPI002E191EA3|nr:MULTISPECIES: hypothetical protein [unclassified Streptomyces]